MKNHSHLIASLLLAGGMLTLAAPGMAEPGDCGPMGDGEKFHQQRNERMQQHQKRLHDALKLTPDQEAAWKKFTESTQPQSRLERGEPQEWAKLTAPERAERMLELSKKRQDRMAEHLAALKTFYGVLTPEQKKIFDDSHAGPRGGRRGHHQPGGMAPHTGPSGSAKG
jgi:protein CpxP